MNTRRYRYIVNMIRAGFTDIEIANYHNVETWYVASIRKNL